MSFVRQLLNKLRQARMSIGLAPRSRLFFGAIYKTPLYQNWKNDPSPLFFCMYSGPMSFVRVKGHYTDGININYLTHSDKLWLARIIYLVKKGQQNIDGRILYKMLKQQRPNIIKTAYRRYHTGMINKPKMVSAGMTKYDKMVYPFSDPFINMLNQQISPESMEFPDIEVSYSQNELAERITNSTNQQSIHNITQQNAGETIKKIGQQKLAPWARKL